MADRKSSTIPSIKNCAIGSDMALANAVRHYRCALKLNEIGEIGVAISHLILAVEEAIKSAVLYFKGLGIPLRQNLVNDICYKHKDRHELGKVVHFITAINFWIFDILMAAHDRSKHKGKEDQKKARDEAVKKLIDDFDKAAKSQDGELHDMLMPLMDWWMDADYKKKSGFYVDFIGGQWITPEAPKQEDYAMALKITEGVILFVTKYREITKTLSEEEKADTIKKMKAEYKKSMRLYDRYKVDSKKKTGAS